MASTYVQTSGTHQTNAANFTPIPGLTLTLPGGVKTEAIIILNVPNPYLTEGSTDSIGAVFGIAVDGKDLPMIASFTYKKAEAFRRLPTTLVVGVALTNKEQKIEGRWAGVRGATVHIDSPASLCYFVD
jgi:mannose-binding lectin